MEKQEKQASLKRSTLEKVISDYVKGVKNSNWNRSKIVIYNSSERDLRFAKKLFERNESIQKLGLPIEIKAVEKYRVEDGEYAINLDACYRLFFCKI